MIKSENPRISPALSVLVAVLAPLIAINGCSDSANTPPPSVHLSVAASLAHVLEGLVEPAKNELSIRLVINTGASGTLAQQTVHGNPCDIFISANPKWMDHLSEQNLIDNDTQITLAGNRLVLFSLSDKPLVLDDPSQLSLNKYHPIALGDPAYVPVGQYALQAIKAHKIDTDTPAHFAQAPDARAVLTYVLAGQCPVGVAYESDVRQSPGLRILYLFKPTDHEPIRYQAAVTKNPPNRDEALKVLQWLQDNTAQEQLARAGFTTHNEPHNAAPKRSEGADIESLIANR